MILYNNYIYISLHNYKRLQLLLTLLVALLKADFMVERSLSAAANCRFVVCLVGCDPMMKTALLPAQLKENNITLTYMNIRKNEEFLFVFKDRNTHVLSVNGPK